MGIGPTVVSYYFNLYSKNFFQQANLCELGDQEVYATLDAFKPIAEHIHSYNPSEGQRMQKLVEQPMFSHINSQEINAKWLYDFLGVASYTSIDVNGLNHSLPYNLNDPLPHAYKQYDIVTNHGTAEHVFDQFEIFRSIHELTKPSGYMLHLLPSQDMYSHCFYFYIWNFYRALAEANQYKIEEAYFYPDTGSKPMFQISEKNPERLLKYVRSSSGALLVLLQKQGSQTFKVPVARQPKYQSKYLSVDSSVSGQEERVDTFLVASHSEYALSILNKLAQNKSIKRLGVLFLDEDSPTQDFKKDTLHTLKTLFYQNNGYRSRTTFDIHCMHVSLSDLDALYDTFNASQSVVLIPSEAHYEAKKQLWNVSFLEHHLQLLEVLEEKKNWSLNSELIEATLGEKKPHFIIPRQELLTEVKTCINSFLEQGEQQTSLSSDFMEKIKYFADSEIEPQNLYRFFPHAWQQLQNVRQTTTSESSEYPILNSLLCLYGEINSADHMMPSSESHAQPTHNKYINTTIQNTSLLRGLIKLVRDYSIKSICDFSQLIWSINTKSRLLLLEEQGISENVDCQKALYDALSVERYLSCPITPLGYCNAFDYEQSQLVTNIQVSNRIFDQEIIFKTMHELCEQGGYMLHYLPCDGYDEASLFLYAWPFYESLAETNSYDICEIMLDLPNDEEEMSHLVNHNITYLLSKLDVKGKSLMVLMKKQTSEPFVTPFQTVYR